MPFTISFTQKAEKEYRKLVRNNPEIQGKVERLAAYTSKDPYNLTRHFDIKKLTNVNTGKWRIRSGNHRIRYDISNDKVIIYGVFDRKKGY